MNGRGKFLDQHQTAWAFEKWNCGYTYEEIGKALYCSYKTVKRAILATYGSQERKRKRPALVYEPPRFEFTDETTEVPEMPEDF